jgi:hypothetical protein
MKTLIRYALVLTLMAVMAVTVLGQSRGGGPSGGSSSSSSGSGSTSSVDSRGSSGVSVSSSSGSGSYDYAPASRGNSGSYSSSAGGGTYGGGGGGGYHYAPNLQGTSWSSYNTWLAYERYYYYMQSMYYMNPGYFVRFSRNVEPLATPELVKLTYRKPLKISLQMLDAVQELEEMLQTNQVDKQSVLSKIQEIRELDKQILKNEGLSFMDQRRDKDTLKAAEVEKLGLDAVAKLREIVTDLSTALKNAYNQSTPSVVSVESLSQPSFKSMCKEIDRVTKVLENSARRL